MKLRIAFFVLAAAVVFGLLSEFRVRVDVRPDVEHAAAQAGSGGWQLTRANAISARQDADLAAMSASQLNGEPPEGYDALINAADAKYEEGEGNFNEGEFHANDPYGSYVLADAAFFVAIENFDDAARLYDQAADLLE